MTPAGSGKPLGPPTAGEPAGVPPAWGDPAPAAGDDRRGASVALSGWTLPPSLVRPVPRAPASCGLARAVESWSASCRVTSFGSSPRTWAADDTSRSVRSAAVGMASTFCRCPICTATSAFMPGRSRPSGLGMFTSTANIVTFCDTVDCGSILSTVPWKGRLEYASTVMVTGIPGWTLPMSVSSTSACTSTVLRSAIWSSTVPPETSRTADVITAPASTFLARMVPSTAASTLQSVRASWALCRPACARTSWARALASARAKLSWSCSLSTPEANIWSARRFCAAAFAACACATSRSAWAWLNAVVGSRRSTFTSVSPRCTMSPVSTRISRIWPDARDFTSTIWIGWTEPLASADTTMSRRVTVWGSYSTMGAGFLQAPSATASAARARGWRRVLIATGLPMPCPGR